MPEPLRCMTVLLSLLWLVDYSTAFLQHRMMMNNSPTTSSSMMLSRSRYNDIPRVTVLPLHATTEEEEEDSKTTFTLSFGDVEFCLTPDTTNAAAATEEEEEVMSISKINKGQVSINLNKFSGQLHIKNLNVIIEDDVDTMNDVEVVEEVEVEVETPPPSQPQSKASIKFDSMLSNFRLHSEADFNLVPSARYRGLLRGTSAAIADPGVIMAFRVLYEDLGPIRVAGDLIFSKLERELAKSKGTDAAANVAALGRDDACVIAARKIFDAVDADASGTVSSQELLESDLLRSLGQCNQCTCGKEGSCQR